MTIGQVQHLLSYLGFVPGVCDGQDGPKTQAAVTAFQRRIGLTQDGQAGPETRKALIDAVANGLPDVPGSDTFWAEIQNFTREEFRCKCGGKYCNGFPAEPKEALVRLAQGARTHFGVNGYVVSGLRCPQWNALQGGVENSQHQYGEALDITYEGVDGNTVLNYFLSQPGVRYAYRIKGTNNVHFDIPKGAR